MAEAAFPVLLGYRACGLRVRAVLFCTESERCCFSSPYNTLFMGFLATVRNSDFTLALVESGEGRGERPLC